MSTATSFREPETIREELADLREYLEGLPPTTRMSGAFDAYLRRMEELNRELASSLLYKTYVEPAEPTIPPLEQLYPKIDHRLTMLEQLHKRSADRYSVLTRRGLWVTMLAASITYGTLYFLENSYLSLTGAIVAAAMAATLAVLRPTDRARKEEQMAFYFKALRSETQSLLDSAADFETRPHGNEKSVRTIEALIRDIQLQGSG